MVGHLRRHFATFSSIMFIYEGNLSRFALLVFTFFIFSSLESNSKVHCSMFSPLEGQLVGFSLMEVH